MRIVLSLAVFFIASSLLSTPAFSHNNPFKFDMGPTRGEIAARKQNMFDSCVMGNVSTGNEAYGLTTRRDVHVDDRISSCTGYIEEYRNAGYHDGSDTGISSVFTSLAVLYHSRRQYDDALTLLNDGVTRFPKDANIFNTRAWNLYQQKKLDAALADANKAVELDGRLVFAYGTRGAIYEAMGNTSRAIADYQQCLRIKSDHEFARAALARLGAPLTAGNQGARPAPQRFDPTMGIEHQRYRSPRQRRDGM